MSDSSDTAIVTVGDIRAGDLCLKGARAWFVTYGLSWSKFLDEKYTVADMEATGDPLALQICAIARERYRRENAG